MTETRRRFLLGGAATGLVVARAGELFAQFPKKFPDPPAPAEQQNPAQSGDAKQNTEAAKRAALRENEKEFREDVEKLYELTEKLREDLAKTPTTEVFSVDMYKRAQAIAKLAKQVKDKAKG